MGTIFDELWRHLDSKVIVLVNLFLVCWLSVKLDFRFAWEAQHVKTDNVVAFRGMVYPQSSSISITTYNSWHFFNTGHDRARTVTTICAPPGGRLRATQCMRLLGAKYAVVGCKVCGCWAHVCGNSWVHVCGCWVQVYGAVGCMPDSR